MTDPVLERLCAQSCVSGEALCAELGMTRGAIWKRMEKLRAEGYRIVSAGKKGYRLEPEKNSLLPGYVQKELTTRWAGRGQWDYRPEMTSTNTRLKEMGQANAPKGSLALCDLQTAGRGRMQRVWQVSRGEALTHSLLLRPALPVEQAQLCTLAAAVAMVQAIGDVCPGLKPGVKWPNDVVIGGRKCVGILSELAADMDGIHYIVMGVGLNVNQQAFDPELTDKATSLLLELRKNDPAAAPLCRRALLCAYLKRMETAMDALEAEGLSGLLPAYLEASVTLGAEVRVIGANAEFAGTAEALDETGALLVRDESGELRRVLSGDVSVRGMMGYA